MTTEKYFNAVEHRDWFHEMSDDGSVYRAGEHRLNELKALAKGNPIFQKILEDWAKHHYSGDPWSTPKEPKPKLSDYL